MSRMPEPSSAPARWKVGLAAVALAAVAGLAYANAAPDAVVFDDQNFFPYDYSYTAEDVAEFFTHDTWEQVGGRSGVYRPGLLLTIAADQKIHGDAPAGYHATNIALHVVATLVVFGLLLALLRGTPAAAGTADGRRTLLAALAAAALFGAHPVHADAVNSIFNRSEILAAIGTAGTLWLLWSQRERRPLLAYGLGALIYSAALLCKESAATTPALFAALVLLLRTDLPVRARLKAIAPAALLLVPLGAYLVLRVRALGGITEVPIVDAEVGGAPLGIADRLALTASSVRDALGMLAWPFPFRATYKDYAASDLPLAALVHAAAAAVVAAALWKRRLAALAAGLAFFYGSLLPSTRLFTNAEISMALAERYVYLPSVGMAIALAFGLAWLADVRRTLVPVAVVGVLALASMPACLYRSADWHSNVALFEAEYRAAPDDGDAVRLVTNAYLGVGRVKEAVDLCDKHLAGHRDNAQLLINCAVAFAKVRRYGDAEREYLEAGKSTVRAVPHANLAALYAKFGHRQRAEEQYRQAIEEEISPAQQRYRRAQMILTLWGDDPARLREAIAELEQAIALRPRMGRAKADLEFARRRLADVTARSVPGARQCGKQGARACGAPQPPPQSSCEEPF
jgi:tetratricopeptide (TPR) repeat protein